MITLQGRNICERQKELNLKVKEAAENKVDLQDVKCEENSDVDRIYKIDLASAYKNIDHVLEELKSGDSLYVSRALKCNWLYSSDYVHLINPDYLHQHIFPTMSLKMQKKTLSAICMHVRDQTRSQLFYKYCMNRKLRNNAFKFLIFTSESFKNEFMKDDEKFRDLCGDVENNFYRKFIGNSLILADTFGKQQGSILTLSYLYSSNEEKYLDLLEKYNETSYRNHGLGLNMSRSVLKKHKDRVLNKPCLYVGMLNRSELIKYSSSEDAKVYAAALLPDHENEFWYYHYCETNKDILNIIKTPSMFEYVKKIFTHKYNGSKYEMSHEFYKYKHYELMTAAEKEVWALKHLYEHTDVIPDDENYKWYEFISFAKSFQEIKALIYTATNLRRRSAMLKVLIKSAKTQSEIIELLNYYYKRHVNENLEIREEFVRAVMDHHRILEFEDACWLAFEKLLHSINVYNGSNVSRYCGNDDIIAGSLIYHIINNRTVSEALQTHLKQRWTNCFAYYYDQMNDEKKELVYNYLAQFLINIISEFESQEYSDAVQKEVYPCLKKILELRQLFKKKDEYPKIVLKYMKLDLDNFQHVVNPVKPRDKTKITEGSLIRCLKKDASLIVEQLPLIRDHINETYDFRMHLLLRKIRIFFPNDIAKQCLDYFRETLYNSLSNNAISEFKALFSFVFAIFQMGDMKLKEELMEKFAPTNPKIQHDEISTYILYTQEAICRFHGYSRPPLPLSKTALFLKGDYVHKCKDIYNMYLVILPPALRTDFISLILNAPVSLQKRGLRLAFVTFDASQLKDLISSVWKKTKNVSLREILYLSLSKKISQEDGKIQEILFELLKEITLTLHLDDTDEVYNCLRSRKIPEKFTGSYLETAWLAVTKLPEKKASFQRKIQVIDAIESNISLMDEEFLARLISDHVQRVLCEQKLRPESNKDKDDLNVTMWDLVARYIVDIPNETKREQKLKVLKTIIKECFDHWNEDNDTKQFVFQQFFKDFVERLIRRTAYCDRKFKNMVHIFEYLLQRFENQFGIPEMYSYFWDWKLKLMMGLSFKLETNGDIEICINFGLQLGAFVRELKSKNQCYMSFFSKILGKISSCIDYIHCEISNRSLTVADVSILVAHGLVHTELFETYLIALEILPINPTEVFKDDFMKVIKKMKDLKSSELTAYMNEKFIYEDFKIRKFM